MKNEILGGKTLILDKKIFILSIIYLSLLFFFILALFLPLRIVFLFKNIFYPSNTYVSFESYFLTANSVPSVISRGTIPLIMAFILFLISVLIFLKFNLKGTADLAKFGYIFALCSSGLLILSIIINLMVYSCRMIDLDPLIITIVTSISIINISSMIFTKRNHFRQYFIEKKIITTEKIIRYCDYCGKEVKLDQKYCQNCGITLNK